MCWPDLALQMIHRLVQRVRTLPTPWGAWPGWMCTGGWWACSRPWPWTPAGGGWCLVRGPMSQARIAERLGASRAMVSRLLQDLARAGCFKVTGGHIAPLKKLPLRW